jgi:phage tail sheath gpL-like
MITFTNIPTTIRTPGVYTEIDNSRALQGLVANPHKALILGQKLSAATTVAINTLQYITNDNIANTYFGAGSPLARMCQIFKKNNPNTELHAIALGSVAGTAASGRITFSANLSVTKDCVYYLMVNGSACYTELTSGWSNPDIVSAIKTQVNLNSYLPVHASAHAGIGSNILVLSAVVSGTLGNYIDFRGNYYAGQSNPYGYQSDHQLVYSAMEGGATDPAVSDAWAVIDNIQYHYIVNPFIDATNLTSLEGELEDRFDPLEDLQGSAFTGARATLASCTTLGNSRNSPFNTIIGAYDSPSAPEEWAAALGGVAAWNLNIDPARPLQFLKLEGILAPPEVNRFSRSERDIILYDGIATFITDNSDNVLIERCITTYQTNSAGTLDSSYLDVETLATLSEIRYQYKTRMVNRFIVPRFKLADDTYPVQPGTYVATPKTVKQEIIALFTLLKDRGLIENLSEFIENLVVERDTTDRGRVNVLLPTDLINAFRVLASRIQFLL